VQVMRTLGALEEAVGSAGVLAKNKHASPRFFPPPVGRR